MTEHMQPTVTSDPYMPQIINCNEVVASMETVALTFVLEVIAKKLATANRNKRHDSDDTQTMQLQTLIKYISIQKKH